MNRQRLCVFWREIMKFCSHHTWEGRVRQQDISVDAKLEHPAEVLGAKFFHCKVLLLYHLSTPAPWEEVAMWRACVWNGDLHPTTLRVRCPIIVSNSSAQEICLLFSTYLSFSSYHCGLVDIYFIFCIITQSILLLSILLHRSFRLWPSRTPQWASVFL